jgi:sugar lactone lactonase YvrE
MGLTCNKMNLELVFYAGSELLEGPVYDSKNNLLYIVSITESKFYSINIHTKEIKTYLTSGHIGCVVIQCDGNLLVAEKNGIFQVNPITSLYKFICQPELNSDMRYNDGIIDSKGRFIFGTKGYQKDYPNQGKVFSLENQTFQTLIIGTTISNGMGFSKNEEKFYFIDTPTKKVGQYSYNTNTGEAVFDSYVIEIEGEGYPDGMCVDIDDMIWIAEWGGGKVCKWNPKTGKKIIEINLPSINVTSCCLGGDHLEYLFISTAKSETSHELLAGGLFKIKIR